MSKTNYWAENIKKLSEKDKVRENIWMYIWRIDNVGTHHLAYEILSNSIDEALAGYCNLIRVTINWDGSLTLEDNWRWIPVWYNKKWVSVIEEIFTVVHMWWKFDREGYEYSGWKHWVWTTVTNYLSEFMEIEVMRDWFHYKLRFDDGNLSEKTHIVWKTKLTWTKVTFKPDATYLTEPRWNYSILSNMLKRQHFLTKDLEYSIKQFNEDWELLNEDTYLNNKWLAWYIDYVTEDESIKNIWPVININDKIIEYNNPQSKKDEKLKLSAAFQYTNQNKVQVTWYTNNINQPEWGTHVNWLKELIYQSIKNACETATIKISKDAIKDDFLNGIVWIVSINLSKPTLEWQTKNKLWDSFVQRLIPNELKEEVENILLQDLKGLQKIADYVAMNVKTRKAIENIENATLKKVKDPTLDPNSKLTDAEGKDRKKCELFIVEWDSAGGWIDEYRNSQTQAIYKLKWKPLNSIITETQKVFDNPELKNLIYAIWTWIWKSYDSDKLRYWKIFILSDADVDGWHIQTLLLGFFKKLMPQLFVNKVIYRIIPPLYWVTEKNWDKVYLRDEKALREYEAANKGKNYLVVRFKWLWEMNPEDLYETCIDSSNRITEEILDTNEEENFEFLNWILWPDWQFKYNFLKNYEPIIKDERKKSSKTEIENVLQETMYDYWMYVNQDRAIPFLEDWLKPVHKRILYAMMKMWVKSNWRTTKSARVVWETIWKYHPHWDKAVYWASVKMTQNFYMSHPLIVKEWNFWSVFWFNSFADMRYTEMKLSQFSEEVLLKDLSDKQQIVRFRPNYDWTLVEPEFLPSVLPVVLMSPTFWIWLWMSSDIPPHNINEVINATIWAIKKWEKFNATDYIKGPDFPMDDNELINSEEEIEKVYNEGWSFRYRLKLHYDEKLNTLTLKSLPYWVEFDRIYKSLLLLARWEKRIVVNKKDKIEVLPFQKSLKNEIKKVENFSWKAWKKTAPVIKIVMTLNKNQNVDIVKAKIYKLTELEKSVSFRPILINRHKRIKKYSLNEIIQEFLVYRRETLTNLFNFKIENLIRTKLINETKILVINNIDTVVNIIRESDSDESAKRDLMKVLKVNDDWAEYILSLQLRFIKKLQKEEILNKIKEIEEEIENYREFLWEDKMNEYIVNELKEYKKKFWQERRTEIIWKVKTVNLDSWENAYEDKEVSVFVSSTWFIYKVSWREDKIENRREIFNKEYKLLREITCNNRDKIYFVQDWKTYFFPIWEIKEELAKPVNIYNEKINIWKDFEVIFTNQDEDKDLFVIFKDWNITRCSFSDLIKTTQGFHFSIKKIIKYYIPNISSKELETNAEKYCYIRYTSEKTIIKHKIEEISKKKSIWTWMKLRWETKYFTVLDLEKTYLVNWKQSLKVEEFSYKWRENKWDKFREIISLDEKIIEQEI